MKPTEIRTYTPESALCHPTALLREMFTDLGRCRGLAWRLLVRDIQAQYRQTILGLLWAFLPPVATTLIFVLLNQGRVLNVSDAISTPYAVFVFSGMILWQTFADAIQAPLRVIDSSTGLLARVSFPREALILSAVGQSAFTSGIRLALLVPLFVMYRTAPTASAVLFLLPFLVLLVMGSVIGVVLSPLGILYKDIQRALPLLLQFWMLLTPVVYARPEGGPLALIARWNPISPLIEIGRHWLIIGPTVPTPQFWLVTVTTVIVAFAGWVVYRVALPVLMDRIGA